LYQFFWVMANNQLERGNLIFSLFINYFFPFFVDLVRLVIKSFFVLLVLFLVIYFFSEPLIVLIKMYPKWYKYYVFLVYVFYLIIGILLSILSRTFREVFFESLDFILNTFCVFIVSNHILNFIMVPIYFFSYWKFYGSAPSVWHYRWFTAGRLYLTQVKRTRRYRKKKRWRKWYFRQKNLFSTHDTFDKGPWQIYSSNYFYIPQQLFELQEFKNLWIHDEKHAHSKSRKYGWHLEQPKFQIKKR